uniref:Uncharacterized protein n=1 Tax=Romanomermis culicivorax TaxID=13658 RepID=A0A915IW53_ROMCU
MVSISAIDKNQSSTGTALLELGSGDDIAIGFNNKKNLFILSGGNKRITGRKHSDTFLLVENASEVVGNLDGFEDGKHIKIHNLMKSANSQLCYDSFKNKFTTYPMPIQLHEWSKTLVLSLEDIIANTDISINKRKTDMKCQSYKDSLILTNLNLDNQIDESNNLTLIFVDYFGAKETSNQTIRKLCKNDLPVT